jgi:hypothetical protein
MKKIIITILLGYPMLACVSTTTTPESKYFEGKITYKSTCTLKTNEFDTAYLYKAFGKIEDFYFKEGNELSKSESLLMPVIIHRQQENKSYFKKNILSDTLYWADNRKPSGSGINYLMV